MLRAVYMLVDKSEYRFPIYVCDTVQELAQITGKSASYINDCIRKAEERGGESQYVRVWIRDGKHNVKNRKRGKKKRKRVAKDIQKCRQANSNSNA